MNRRRLLSAGIALLPLASAILAACGKEEAGWADGMVPIKWDRDACAKCGMVISDRRFAVEIRGGPHRAAFKFDDIGCAATWYGEKRATLAWLDEDTTRYWVADFARQGTAWLDARRARYATGARSPMGYDFAAYADDRPGSLDFAALALHVSKGARAHGGHG